MADQDMRLRLIVRRNGLPEIRLMWNVRLDCNPTIAKLLEQLNGDVPLESDDWGLEDYVVELHDNDGTDFECLHYQLVRSVLKPDDRIYIRALERDDHRRRRISGRHQISSDGRHLIDGVPFGRPRLRASNGRPVVHIPPRKRARFTYAQPNDDLEEDLETGGDAPVLMLTNGDTRIDRNPSSRPPTLLDTADVDSDSDDADFTDTADQSNLSDQSSVEEEWEDEDMADGVNPGYHPSAQGNDEEEGHDEGEDDECISNASTVDLAQEARDLAKDNTDFHGEDLAKDGPAVTDQICLLKAAFPTAPAETCDKILAASNGDLKITYNVLAECFAPRLPRGDVLDLAPKSQPRGAGSRQPQGLGDQLPARGTSSAPFAKQKNARELSPAEDSEKGGDESHEEDAALTRKYDYTGFPPGTITSGKGLAHMAAVSTSFASSCKASPATETMSTTLKAAREESAEDDDDTSSSGSSDSSDTSSDESDDANENAFSGAMSSDRSASSNSEGGDDSSDESEEPDENGAYRTSIATRASSDNDSDSSSDSDSDSESGPEEQSAKAVDGNNLASFKKQASDSNVSSDESSDAESTDTDSNSGSDAEVGDKADVHKGEAASVAVSKPRESQVQSSVPEPKGNKAVAIPVRPGAGKESTKRRNARRRAAKLAKREAEKAEAGNPANKEMKVASAGNGSDVDQARVLFEAKRKALLDAIATGGIEVGCSGETALERGFTGAGPAKRKRTEDANAGLHHSQEAEEAEAADELAPDDHSSTPVSEKRRRIDLGAGRRLVFGALGLRNPKNKEDEDKLRGQLQSNIRQTVLLQEASRNETPVKAVDSTGGITGDDEDADAWKLKINYRAVECCHDGIELSPAPFPFQQRWDPQQRSSKKNKRGGQSKRQERNQSHFYQNDGGSKRKRRDSCEGVDDGYDDGGHGATEAGVTLNYDDTESPEHQGSAGGSGYEPLNEVSQTTDLDDLPSLPTDVSALPTLHPGQAQVGMVISWQKWSCSSATSWQPQLSRVTAIVVRVDEDTAALDVCLAKRDRYLDGNEKHYDERTGERIYNKFEAPDFDDEDDDGVDEGYRSVLWAEMQDPKILQQPLDPTVEIDVGFQEANIAQAVSADTGTKKQTEELESAIPETVPTSNAGSSVTDSLEKSNALTGAGLEDASVDPPANVASNSTSCQAGIGQQTTDMSMSDISQISSPSRQLHETTSQAISSDFPAHNDPSTLERVERSSQVTSSSVPLPTAEISLPRLVDFESDAIAGTPKALQHKAVIPSSTSSVQSGRQPDFAINNDDDDDDDDHVSDSFNPIDNQDYHVLETSPPLTDHSSIPITPRRPTTPDKGDKTGDKTGGGLSPKPSPAASHSSRSSLSSLNSIWCTALTSRSTQTPSKIQQSSSAQEMSTPKACQALQDNNYEEAMHELEDHLDRDNDLMQASVLHATENLTKHSKVKEEGSSSQFQLPSLRVSPREKLSLLRRNAQSISPPLPRRRSSGQKKPKQPFTIPAGSQVVELLSSDSEPMYTENYADDDVDGTYSPDLSRNSLPSGEGWVKKKKKRDGYRRKTRG